MWSQKNITEDMISGGTFIKHKNGRPKKMVRKEIFKNIRFSKTEYFIVKQKASKCTDEAPPNKLVIAVKSIQSEFIEFASTLSANNKKINALSEELQASGVNSHNPKSDKAYTPFP